MHGLINRSFENFLRNTYGAALWQEVMRELDAGLESFEPMFRYDDGLTARVVAIAAARLDKPREVLLEDFGTYLVVHPTSHRTRRLLRFGGVDYEDFLLSLEDLPGRARLAVPDLDLPQLDLSDQGGGEFALDCACRLSGAGAVFVGLLRAMADDYGALVFIDHQSRHSGVDRIAIRVFKSDYAKGRAFALAERATG